MKKLTVLWTGMRPLIMHNGILADPLADQTKALKVATSVKKKTDSDHEKIGRLEWMASLYRGDRGQIVIPSDNIERCILDGARKAKIGKAVQAALFLDTEAHPTGEVDVIYPGLGDNPEKLYDDPKKRFTLRKGVKVTTSRVMRVRPMIPTGWKIKFTVEYDDGIVNEREISKAMSDAGMWVGLGDWRPKFGRFTSEVV